MWDFALIENLIVLTLLTFLITTIVVGNGLVIFAWMTQKSLRSSPSNAYIASLAFVDILVGMVVLPVDFAVQLQVNWASYRTICQFRIVSIVSLTTVSIFHLIAIAWDRYRIVMDGVQYIQKRSLRSVFQILIVMWIIALWIALPPVLDQSLWPENANNCNFKRSLGWVLHSSFGSFIFPTILMIKIYSSVYLEIQKRFQMRKQIKQEDIRQEVSNLDLEYTEDSFDNLKEKSDEGDDSKTELPQSSQVPTAIAKKKMKKFKVSLKQENKAAKTLGIIFAAFLICWLPFFTIHLLSAIVPSWAGHFQRARLYQLLAFLGYANSGVNPLIYAIYNLEFKEAFKRILICKICSLRK